VLERFEHGHGSEAEIDTLVDLCDQIGGRSFCALGDAAATPYPAALKYFRHEFEAGINQAAELEFAPAASYLFSEATAR
jgi:NADH-quinone oxidoreductase subunit F